MRQKGISDAEILAVMEEADCDWYILASEVLERKFGALPPEDMKAKAKRVRFMQYRGFQSEHFSDLLD